MTTTVLLIPEDLDRHRVEVVGDRYRHLFRARRLKTGDRLRVVDGRGRARWARVVKVDRRAGVLELAGEAPLNEPDRRLELVVVPPKPQRLTWLVEKCTEVGVSSIRLIQSRRGPRTVGEGTLERLSRVAEAAVMQSHRSLVPEISGVHEWRELEALISESAARFSLDPSAESSSEIMAFDAASLLVGPEGGWDEQERSDMAAMGCRPLVLGPRILRTETAAVLGLGLLLGAGARAL